MNGIRSSMLAVCFAVVAVVGTPFALKTQAEPDTFCAIDFPGAIKGKGTFGTIATGISPAGEIVGNYRAALPPSGDGRFHGFLLRVCGGEFTTIDVPVPGATATFANGINARGDIVGRYDDSDGISHGYLLRGTEVTKIDPPEATFTAARDINPSGDVVGIYQTADQTADPGCKQSFSSCKFHGFLLSGGKFTTIDVPVGGAPSSDTEPNKINPRGDIVGRYDDAEGKLHGFLLSGGEFTTIDPVPGATRTVANGINPRGDIVGRYDIAGMGHGYLLSKGEVTTIDFPDAILTAAAAINPRGDIIGHYTSVDGNQHGLLLGQVVRR